MQTRARTHTLTQEKKTMCDPLQCSPLIISYSSSFVAITSSPLALLHHLNLPMPLPSLPPPSLKPIFTTYPLLSVSICIQMHLKISQLNSSERHICTISFIEHIEFFWHKLIKYHCIYAYDPKQLLVPFCCDNFVWLMVVKCDHRKRLSITPS